MLCTETCGCNNPGGEFINVQGCPYLDGECRHVDAFEEYQEGSLKCSKKQTFFLNMLAFSHHLSPFSQATEPQAQELFRSFALQNLHNI